MRNTATPDLDLETACDCGAVTLSAKGRVISMFKCGCLHCQKVSGSGHASVVLFPADGIQVTGDTRTHARPADSGATLTRHFCPSCGTTLYAQSSRAPAFAILQAGLFAGQNAWFTPNQLIFARNHPAWDLVDTHMPHHAAYRPEKST